MKRGGNGSARIGFDSPFGFFLNVGLTDGIGWDTFRKAGASVCAVTPAGDLGFVRPFVFQEKARSGAPLLGLWFSQLCARQWPHSALQGGMTQGWDVGMPFCFGPQLAFPKSVGKEGALNGVRQGLRAGTLLTAPRGLKVHSACCHHKHQSAR